MVKSGVKLKTSWTVVIELDADNRLTAAHLRRFTRRAESLGKTFDQHLEDIIIAEASSTPNRKRP